ncbi:hypothetical protein Ddc_02919 [Ditylenchus destructor]|nr:hypothetical protein Ddc_02919 [Ditylenchus destructor]
MSELRKVSDINMSTDDGKSISDNGEMEISGTANDGNPNNTVSMSEESVIENTEAMDTDMEDDEPNILPNWNVGDVIMCQWGPNQNIYYEGKVTEVDNFMGQPRYFVHYKGWGAKYDEKFLHEDALKFFKPATEELKQRTKVVFIFLVGRTSTTFGRVA